MTHFSELFNTYSIVARDAQTGDMGVAVQTHQMCVGAVVPWLKPGVGAIATQASTNPCFGPLGLALLEEGLAPAHVVDSLVASDEQADRRQFAVVDPLGRVAAWTGSNCISEAGHHIGDGFSVQANMMTNDTVIEAMASAYLGAEGDLAGRMMAALFAAQEQGGDIRGMQSAALKVVKSSAEGEDSAFRRIWPYNLRVDEHDRPVEELARLVRLRHARLIDAQGHLQLEGGQVERALEIWEEARQRAPELEELSFWQSAALADIPQEVQLAAEILQPMLEKDDRRDHWIDLVRRIQECGIIERQGAGDELLQAISLNED